MNNGRPLGFFGTIVAIYRVLIGVVSTSVKIATEGVDALDSAVETVHRGVNTLNSAAGVMEENALKNYRKVKVACEIETAELYLQYPYHVPDDYTFPTGFLENYNGIYSHNVPVILSQQIDTSASLLLEKK